MCDRRLSGLEALIRGNHPERGFLYPHVFIPKAEEIGLINKIGDWVLREACHQLKAWQAKVAGFEKITLHEIVKTVVDLCRKTPSNKQGIGEDRPECPGGRFHLVRIGVQ